MFPRRCNYKGWVVVFLVLCAFGAGAAAQKPLTLPEVEKRLVRGGYLDTLFAAYWAAQQGEAIVPLLARMLDKPKKYGEAAGAFPFNALWALAHIPGADSLKVLEKYQAASRDETAALAIQGHKLRLARQSPQYGVLLTEADLLAQARETASVVQRLTAGQQVKILQEKILSPGEEGPRGGPAYYDRVQLLPGGEQGYIQRAGDDFTPFI